MWTGQKAGLCGQAGRRDCVDRPEGETVWMGQKVSSCEQAASGEARATRYGGEQDMRYGGEQGMRYGGEQGMRFGGVRTRGTAGKLGRSANEGRKGKRETDRRENMAKRHSSRIP